MNHEHAVQSASTALLRASNALEDLQGYLQQIAGGVRAGLADTTRKIDVARDLVREIDSDLHGLSTQQAKPRVQVESENPARNVPGPTS